MGISLDNKAATPGSRGLNPAVVIMAKVPKAGEVKTRLTPPLSASEAASLACCFIQDTVVKAMSVCSHVIIAHPPVEDAEPRASLQVKLPPGLIWMEQRGHDLGERLTAIAGDALRLGFNPVLIIGADSPTLPEAFLKTAIAALVEQNGAIVLGPTKDGGYYLVGLTAVHRGLFDNVLWSTSRTFQQTRDNARLLNLRVVQTPHWYDVDLPSDLKRLHDELCRTPCDRVRAPATYDWLLSHHGRFF